MTLLTYDEFEELNSSELDCIFSETGMDRERGFDLEHAVETFWFERVKYSTQYPQLKYYK